jgi:anti-sigma factor RsiW
MQHLDEGTIHAWIDGALGSDEAREVEAHLASCEECARLATEARGLVAASSRILTALDNVPARVLPATATPAKAAERVVRRWPTPFWMRAAAAIVIVAGASALVMRPERLNSPEPRHPALAEAPIAVSMDSLAGPQSAPAETRAPEDNLASAPPRVGAGQAGGVAQPFSAKVPGVAQPKPGRPGSRTESSQKQVAAATLARRADEVEQDASMDRAATRVSDAAQKAKEEGTGGLQMKDSSASRRGVVAMASPAPKGQVAASRPASALEKLAEPMAPKVEGNRLKTAVGGLGSTRAAAPSVASSAATNAPITGADPAVGCYALSLSPWSGGTIPFGAPPARIELDSLTSVQETMRGYNLVHPARGTASNGAPYAYWNANRDSVYITWRDNQRGVTLTLPAGGSVVVGTARTFSTSTRDVTQTTQVEARRISCRE